jgi:cephalosporin hydroxylase
MSEMMKGDLVDHGALTIDFDAETVSLAARAGHPAASYPFSDPRAFELVANAYLRLGWDHKYVYSFSWLGRPVIQLPDDLLTLQEIIYKVRPDVIVDIGVAHGGSLVFHAGLCRAMGRGRVIGVDIEIRPHNRVAIENHELSPLITLIEGDSVAPATVADVRKAMRPGERVLVILDGNHRGDHVAKELAAYAPLVTPDSYIVAMDGITGRLAGAPRSGPDWATNNPRSAAEAFVAANPDFVIANPAPAFNEGSVSHHLTYSPHGYVKRLR